MATCTGFRRPSLPAARVISCCATQFAFTASFARPVSKPPFRSMRGWRTRITSATTARPKRGKCSRKSRPSSTNISTSKLAEGRARGALLSAGSKGAPFSLASGVEQGRIRGPGHTIEQGRPMKRSDLTEKLLDIKREKGWSWKYICEKVGGYSEVLIVGAILGQMKLTKPQAANAGELFGLSKSGAAGRDEVPMRGMPMPPTDPLIYRFFELVMVNGPAWKALIEEEFGDGIMSAIDFDMVMERVANPKGDRVKITMTGKFLPYKYYGASGNVPEYGFKEE